MTSVGFPSLKDITRLEQEKKDQKDQEEEKAKRIRIEKYTHDGLASIKARIVNQHKELAQDGYVAYADNYSYLPHAFDEIKQLMDGDSECEFTIYRSLGNTDFIVLKTQYLILKKRDLDGYGDPKNFTARLAELGRNYSVFKMAEDYTDCDHVEWKVESKKKMYYGIIAAAKELGVEIVIPDLHTPRRY